LPEYTLPDGEVRIIEESLERRYRVYEDGDRVHVATDLILKLDPSDRAYFSDLAGVLRDYSRMLVDVSTRAGLDRQTLNEITATPRGNPVIAARSIGFDSLVAHAVEAGLIPVEVMQRLRDTVMTVREMIRPRAVEDTGLFAQLGRVMDYYDGLAGDLF
jgi:hypothetical protein